MNNQAAGLYEARRPSAKRSVLPSEPGGPKLLGVVSGKGGVGKSTLAANLAVACARHSEGILLIDGDEGLANADLLLGLVPAADLADWCRGDSDYSAVRTNGPRGLELIVSGAGSESVAALESSIEATRTDSTTHPASALTAHLRRSRLTVLDLGAGIGASVVSLARHCEPLWLVVTPEPTSLADAYATARRLWQTAPDLRIEVVVNRAGDRDTGFRAHQALDRMTRRFLSRPLPLRSVLTEDPAMLRAVALQQPAVERFPGAPVSRRIELLAEAVLEEPTSTLDRVIPV